MSTMDDQKKWQEQKEGKLKEYVLHKNPEYAFVELELRKQYLLAAMVDNLNALIKD